jgi:hypothetical protein
MGLISNGSTIFDAGSMASGFGGSMTFIKKLTASASATLSFVDGTDGVVLDDTYKEYVFTFNNIHPATTNVGLTFNMSIDGGSNYNVAKTTTAFRAINNEADNDTSLAYQSSLDLAQGTGFQGILNYINNDNDSSGVGQLTIYSPSSTTFVKHFISVGNTHSYFSGGYTMNDYVAGYGNTTSAVDAIRFQMSSGNIDSGVIKLYGVA